MSASASNVVLPGADSFLQALLRACIKSNGVLDAAAQACSSIHPIAFAAYSLSCAVERKEATKTVPCSWPNL
eukprot:1159836-Pelagomonas_calceolata.AAC.1